MPEWSLLSAFLLAISLLTLAPGVDSLLVIRNSMRGGWQDGVITSLGICLALFVQATISALGLSVLLLQSATAFTAVKLAGAAYLVWLGFASLHQAVRGQSLSLSTSVVKQSFRPIRSLREGLLSNLLNPKAILFYMALLPQFIDADRPALSQSLVLAAIHFAIAMGWQSFLAIGVYRIKHWLQKERLQRALNTAMGSVLVFLGINLGFSDA